MKWSITALTAVAVSLIAAVLSILQKDGITLSLALFSALSSMILVPVSDCRFESKALGIAIVVLIVALAMGYGLSYDDIVLRDQAMDVYSWALLAAAAHTVPLPPLTLLLMQTLAVRFGASYNWALGSALYPFYALGLVAPGFILTYFIQGIDTVSPYVTNAYIGWGVAVPLFVSIAIAIALRRWMRANDKIINSNGMASRV